MQFDYQQPNPVPIRTATVDQLRALRDGKRDVLIEIAFAAVGAMAGAIPTAFPVLWQFTSGPATLSGTEMLHVLLFLTGLILSVTCTFISKARGKKAGDIFEEIVNPKGEPNAP